MEKIYRAAKYIRRSYPDDEFQYRGSAVNQSKLIDAFIQTHPEIIVVSEKIDNGHTGVNFERPAMQEILELVKLSRIDCIIVKDGNSFLSRQDKKV